jgi:hypothetical protein
LYLRNTATTPCVPSAGQRNSAFHGRLDKPGTTAVNTHPSKAHTKYQAEHSRCQANSLPIFADFPFLQSRPST